MARQLKPSRHLVNKDNPLYVFTWSMVSPMAGSIYNVVDIREALQACELKLRLQKKRWLTTSETSKVAKRLLEYKTDFVAISSGVYLVPNTSHNTEILIKLEDFIGRLYEGNTTLRFFPKEVTTFWETVRSTLVKRAQLYHKDSVKTLVVTPQILRNRRKLRDRMLGFIKLWEQVYDEGWLDEPKEALAEALEFLEGEFKWISF